MARASAGKQPRKRHRRRRRGASEDAAAAAVGPDCFTHLHDDLLRSIVHRLPVRSAASLAGVSRHFRAQVPAILDRVDSLTLHEPHFPTPLPDTRPLLLRRLAIAPRAAISPSKFRPILGTAAGHGLTELCIRLRRRSRLPKNVFSIRSLAVLTLDTCAVPRWSEIACPCLRTLKLNRVAIHQKTINQIFASASVLETLEMIYCTGLGTGTGTGGGCTVESSSVKNLVFRPPLKQSGATIRAPGLRTVTLYTRAKARRLELAPAPEVRKAYLHICKPLRPMDSFRVRSFLDAAASLNCLTLRGLAMKLLSSEYNDTPNMKIVFQNLRILSVSLDLSRESELVFLLKLLESCPNLQRLTISDVNTKEGKAAETIEDKAPALEGMDAETDEGMDMDAATDEGMDAATDEGMDAETDEGMDAATDKVMDAATDEGMDAATDEDNAVPCFNDHKERLTKIPCLTSSLAEFRFLGFKPEEYEKSLVMFLLTQAKNLRTVGVQFEKNQETAIKEILSVRKASSQRTCHKYANLYMEQYYS